MPAPKDLKKKKIWQERLSNAKFKGGLPKCLDCGKQLAHYRSKYCMSCAKKGKNNPNYIDNRTNRLYFCMDCGKEISSQTGCWGLGRCQKCYQKYTKKEGTRTGKNNPMFGKIPYNYKSGYPKCNNCGKLLKSWYGKRCIPCFIKWNVGINNPNWKGGKSNEPYPFKFNKILKESIRQRDDYTCQICGKTEKQNGRKLDVHHIDYDKKNLDPKNLISLCPNCHLKTNGSRTIYIEYFGLLIKEEILC